MNKKILHITSSASYDGTFIYALRLADSLTNYDNYVLIGNRGKASEEIANLDLKITYLLESTKERTFDFIRKSIKFLYHLLKNKYDIIHYHAGGISLLLTAVLFSGSKKIIHHVHCGNINCKQNDYGLTFTEKIIYKLLSRKTFRIFVAEHVQENYISHINVKSDNYVIKNTVPFKFRKKEALYRKIGYLGQISDFKGLTTIVEILNTLKAMNIKLELKGEVKQQYDEISYEAIIHDPSLDINSFLSSIDILLLPSRATEGLPLVILESFANDTAVLYNSSYISDEISEDYPFFVEHVKSQFEEMIYKFYNDSGFRNILSNYHENICNVFNYEEMLQKIIDIYEK